jgi:hypothetical protein
LSLSREHKVRKPMGHPVGDKTAKMSTFIALVELDNVRVMELLHNLELIQQRLLVLDQALLDLLDRHLLAGLLALGLIHNRCGSLPYLPLELVMLLDLALVATVLTVHFPVSGSGRVGRRRGRGRGRLLREPHALLLLLAVGGSGCSRSRAWGSGAGRTRGKGSVLELKLVDAARLDVDARARNLQQQGQKCGETQHRG